MMDPFQIILPEWPDQEMMVLTNPTSYHPLGIYQQSHNRYHEKLPDRSTVPVFILPLPYIQESCAKLDHTNSSVYTPQGA